ncbi:glucokinase [Aeromicrobium marinum DSM 15272]|uniref:Glucokinase n=1 Tax=Aeromicrobium marinum DSM 15272 TaxID=585531 RepID=E2SAL9_9ACTN|nr:ROK family protein [Aeromicrobium marinum]EFQ83415.1 glucokinase [Aeromicrobium marinum DSM 15272]
MTTGVAVGVDVGGTKIAAGVVDHDGRIVARGRITTPTEASAIPGAVAALVHEVAGGAGVDTVGVGAAGFIAADRRTVRFAPNIDWEDEPLAATLEPLVGATVVVENDANAAAWGEFRFGAGRAHDDLLLVTVGTGVGGGIVSAGQLLRGAHGIAAEVGHLCLVPDGRACPCGQRGCLEQYASGTALVRSAARHSEPGTVVDGAEVTRRAAGGDAEAQQLLADLGERLGRGIAALVAVLDPAVVVVGGGVGAAGDLLLEPVRRSLNAHVTGGRRRPVAEVLPAVLGNDAGLIGAADLGRAG